MKFYCSTNEIWVLIARKSLTIVVSDIWGGGKARDFCRPWSGEGGGLISCWGNRLCSVCQKEGAKESVTFDPGEFKHA